MTMSSEQSSQSYPGNGAASTFTIPFRVLDKSHLVITIQSDIGSPRTLVEGTDFTLSNMTAYTGWQVNLIQPVINYGTPKPLAVGETLIIKRVPPFTQDTNLRDSTSFLAETHENKFDYLTMLSQRLRDSISDLSDRVANVVTQSVQAFRLMGATSGYTDLTTDAVAGVTQANFPSTGAVEQVTYQSMLTGVLAWVSDATMVVLQPFTGAVPRTQHDKNAEVVTTKDLGCKGDGVTDDYAKLSAAIANFPEGGTLYVEGITKINTPLVISRRVSLVCRGADDAILLNVGSTNDGITYQGPTGTGTNAITSRLNVYGGAGCAKNAVVLSRLYRSNISLNVHAGAAAYGVKISGGLINRYDIDISNNYNPPISSALPLDGVLIEKDSAYSVATNACELWVNIEGIRHGIVATVQPGEGQNWIRGCIEGCTGSGIIATGNIGLHLSDLWMEANAADSVFTDCTGVEIGPRVWNPSNAAINLVNCIMPRVHDYYGPINVDSQSAHGAVSSVITNLGASTPTVVGEGYAYSLEQIHPTALTGSKNVTLGGPGRIVPENLFPNPWMDIWDNGTTSAPAGVTLVGATCARATATPLPGAGGATMDVTITSAGVNSGAHFSVPAPNLTWAGADRFVAFTIAIYVPTGTTTANVYGPGGELIAKVTAKDTWVYVRGSSRVVGGGALDLWVALNDGVNWQTGTYKIGGINICNGTIAPKFLADHGRRSEYIVNNVSYTPAFLGQRAFISGTGKWYMAKGTTSSADWVLLN